MMTTLFVLLLIWAVGGFFGVRALYMVNGGYGEEPSAGISILGFILSWITVGLGWLIGVDDRQSADEFRAVFFLPAKKVTSPWQTDRTEKFIRKIFMIGDK